MSDYSEKLRDPRWQKKRLEILERDGWRCQLCMDNVSTLIVHHLWYEKVDPWAYPDDALLTLCESCHDLETQERPVQERALLHELRRRKFTAEDISNISGAFNRATNTAMLGELLYWLFDKDDLMQELWEKCIKAPT